jgi:hypothetical protein
MHETRRAQLLEFLAPGFLHTLGNALFTIQGNAQILGRLPDTMRRQREEILAGCARTREALLVYRVIADPAPEGDGLLLGTSLPVLIDMLRVALRERGVGLRVTGPLPVAPVTVSRKGLVVGLVATCHALERGLRGGFDRELELRMQAAGVEFGVEFQALLAPERLPFTLDLTPELETLAPVLAEAGLKLRAAPPRGCAFDVPRLARLAPAAGGDRSGAHEGGDA